MPDRPRQGKTAPTAVNPPRKPATKPPTPAKEPDIKTRLDGQRGWLNEIDRSLKKRSLIALVLTCLAIGAGAAAIYIAISNGNNDSERIDALETRVDALEAATGTTATPEEAVPETTTPGATEETTPVLPDTGTGGGGTTDPDPLSPGAAP